MAFHTWLWLILFMLLWDSTLCCHDCMEVSGNSADPLVGFYELVSSADDRCPDECLYIRNGVLYCFKEGNHSVTHCASEWMDVGDNELNTTIDDPGIIVPLPPTLYPEYMETNPPKSDVTPDPSISPTPKVGFSPTKDDFSPSSSSSSSSSIFEPTSPATKISFKTTITPTTTPKPNFADHVRLTFSAFLPLRFGIPWTFGVEPAAITGHKWNWLEGPPDWADGDMRLNTDDRNWAAQKGSSKLRTDFTIFFKDLGKLTWATFFRKTSVGLTHSIHTEGNPITYIGGTHASKRAKASKRYSFVNGECSVKVCVKAAASMPFFPSPAVNYKVCFHIRYLGHCDYEIFAEGDHNEFPSYEAEVNSGDIYFDHAADGPGANLIYWDNFKTKKIKLKGPHILC